MHVMIHCVPTLHAHSCRHGSGNTSVAHVTPLPTPRKLDSASSNAAGLPATALLAVSCGQDVAAQNIREEDNVVARPDVSKGVQHSVAQVSFLANLMMHLLAWPT
jgi:hypothetical protein